MKVSDYVAEFLAAQGITHAFELSGGMITHLLDSVAKSGKTKLIDMRHEQAAGFAAEGWARMTGKPGVAFATSGPGATNLLTAIASCYFDSTPAVFITGQVPRNELRGDKPIRQLGFQETDIVAMAKPVTKAAWRTETGEEIPRLLASAFVQAQIGRPGPTLLDIPLDVSAMEIAEQRAYPLNPLVPSCLDHVVEGALRRFLDGAERPLILIGGGCTSPRVREAVRAFVAQLAELNVPAVSSLLGLDVAQTRGMIGSYGNRWANWALANADSLLVLGSRLDVRQTGASVGRFLEGKRTVVQVDIDIGEIGARVPVTQGLVSTDVGAFCEAATGALCGAQSIEVPSAWWQSILDRAVRWPHDAELTVPRGTINPNEFMRALGEASPDAAAFVLDVGAHQMWAAQSLWVRPHQRIITSGGMGAMGWALPAAIGAAFASPGKPIVVITGDGGFQCNIQELQTIVDHRLPIQTVVLANEGHAMVRQFQDAYFDGRHVATAPTYPDFQAIAAAYGVSFNGVSKPEAIEATLRWLARRSGVPTLLQVQIASSVGIAPKMTFGKGLDEMDPPRD